MTGPRAASVAWVARTLEFEAHEPPELCPVLAESFVAVAEQYDRPIEELILYCHTPGEKSLRQFELQCQQISSERA